MKKSHFWQPFSRYSKASSAQQIRCPFRNSFINELLQLASSNGIFNFFFFNSLHCTVIITVILIKLAKFFPVSFIQMGEHFCQGLSNTQDSICCKISDRGFCNRLFSYLGALEFCGPSLFWILGFGFSSPSLDFFGLWYYFMSLSNSRFLLMQSPA